MNYVNSIKKVGVLYDFMNHNKRERYETILEPLQAILQLGFLSYCPQGTKITIHNNLLCIQEPSFSQSLIRWYHNDTKDDLFYLFNVCQRFTLYYQHLKEIKIETTKRNKRENLYSLLIQMSKRGLDKLIQTYSTTDKISLLHTLQLYKSLLDIEPQLVNETENEKVDKSMIENNNNINRVFQRITTLYNDSDYHMLLHSLILMREKKEYYRNYIHGINEVLNPCFSKISEWIHKHLIF